MRVLTFIRGLVRPIALLAFIFANLGLLIAGVFIEDARDYIFQAVAIIEGPTLLILGFWFRGRVETSEIDFYPSNFEGGDPREIEPPGAGPPSI